MYYCIFQKKQVAKNCQIVATYRAIIWIRMWQKVEHSTLFLTPYTLLYQVLPSLTMVEHSHSLKAQWHLHLISRKLRKCRSLTKGKKSSLKRRFTIKILSFTNDCATQKIFIHFYLWANYKKIVEHFFWYERTINFFAT